VSEVAAGPSALVRAVRTYVDHLVVERGLAENSVSSYRRDLRRYLGYLDSVGVTDLDQVTEQTVSGFLAWGKYEVVPAGAVWQQLEPD
jgi:integrase/recombinase XerD